MKALRLNEPVGARINDHQTVIGVVSDFHWESLRNPIAPVAIMRGQKYFQLGLRLTGQPADVLDQVRQTWKKFSSEPISYHFLDQNFESILRKERVLQSAITFFTGLAMVISCLGLYGLSAFTSIQRTKEIGIRKAMGATLKDILLLLNTKLFWLLGGGILVGGPLAYFAMLQWLQGFAYHIEPGYGVFIISVLLSLITSWLAVAYHSLRATRVNPAETLRWE